jgi:hypothetical protein
MLTKIFAALIALHLGATAFAGADPLAAAAKLREYCRACHAVGTMKFIQSDDDRVLWDSLFVNTAPHTGKTWAQGIVEVLSWPSDTPPPFDRVMDPPTNRDWMPRGAKRLDLAADVLDGTPVRKMILDAIKARSSGTDY